MFDARAVASRRPFPIWGVVLGLLLGVNLLVVLTVLLRDERAAAASDAAASDAAASVSAPASATQVGTVATSRQAAPAVAAPAVDPRPTTPTPARTAPSATPTDTAQAAASAPTAAPADLSDLQSPSRTRDDLLAAGDAIPEAALSLHVYDPDASKRFILLNGQRLREGEMTGNGLRVRGIVPDGVVLDHRGVSFKVPIEP